MVGTAVKSKCGAPIFTFKTADFPLVISTMEKICCFGGELSPPYREIVSTNLPQTHIYWRRIVDSVENCLHQSGISSPL